MAANRIEVHGLRELRRALKEAENRSPKELQQANKRSAERVAGAARQRAPIGKARKGHAAGTLRRAIKAQATAGRALVAFGGSRAPYGPVINFGGTIPRFHSALRTVIPQQEHIYAAIHAERQEVLREYEQALKRIAKHL
jgi:phage gpG-like protein